MAGCGGPTMFARIGVMRALHRNVERVFNRGSQRDALGKAEAEPRSVKEERTPPDLGFSQAQAEERSAAGARKHNADHEGNRKRGQRRLAYRFC